MFTKSRNSLFVQYTQAVERCCYAVAELLVSTCPTVVKVRDKRGQLAIDLLKAPDVRWGELLNQKNS